MWSIAKDPVDTLANRLETAPIVVQVREQTSDAAFDDDVSLIQALVRDEPSAWRAFNARFSRLILSTITRIVGRFRGVVSEDDVREIYATLCLQLLQNDRHKLTSFDPSHGTKFSTWLGLLASHAAYDFLRGARRRPQHCALSEAEDLSSESPDPSEVAQLHERAELVAELLASFSEKDRQFIRLYYAECLSPEEVSERMGISVKTVYSKKHKIQNRLEVLLRAGKLAA